MTTANLTLEDFKGYAFTPFMDAQGDSVDTLIVPVDPTGSRDGDPRLLRLHDLQPQHVRSPQRRRSVVRRSPVSVAAVTKLHSDILDAELRADVRARGLRATGARIAVLRMLAVGARPMSHAELFTKLPDDFDRTTIFRALGVLTAARLILRVELGDRVWRYTRAQGAPADGALAATFVCTACGEIEELAHVSISSTKGPRSLRRRAVSVFVHGKCDTCA